jgi:hypothetical protein
MTLFFPQNWNSDFGFTNLQCNELRKTSALPYTIVTKPSRKRKVEVDQGTAVKCPRLCRKRKQQGDTQVNPYKQTRLGEDQEEVLFGLLILEMHDALALNATIVLIFNHITSPCNLGQFGSPIQRIAWCVDCSKYPSLGALGYQSHPRYGLLRRSCRISTLSR